MRVCIPSASGISWMRGELGLGAVHHREQVGGRGLVDLHGQRLVAVEEVELLLAGEVVVDVRHVPDGQPERVQWQVPDLVEGVELADAADQELAGALLDVAAGEVDVGGAEGLATWRTSRPWACRRDGRRSTWTWASCIPRTSTWATPSSRSSRRWSTSSTKCYRRSRDQGALRWKRSTGMSVALEAPDEDPPEVGRQEVSDPVDPVPHLDRREVHVGAVLEADADVALARRSPGAEGLDAVDGPQGVLEGPDDAPLDLLRGRGGVGGRDPDARRREAGQELQRAAV